MYALLNGSQALTKFKVLWHSPSMARIRMKVSPLPIQETSSSCHRKLLQTFKNNPQLASLVKKVYILALASCPHSSSPRDSGNLETQQEILSFVGPNLQYLHVQGYVLSETLSMLPKNLGTERNTVLGLDARWNRGSETMNNWPQLLQLAFPLETLTLRNVVHLHATLFNVFNMTSISDITSLTLKQAGMGRNLLFYSVSCLLDFLAGILGQLSLLSY